MSGATPFSPDYVTARQRFREGADRLGWQREAHRLEGVGPRGEELAVDVARSPGEGPGPLLVVSSGVHGVEGFFGSAVQVALLEQWARQPPAVQCLFLHGLNPHGFAWLRRFNENNVDLNRNFLLPGERYEGVPEHYPELEPMLNPRRPPVWWDPFTLRALGAIARHGMANMRQAVASGQYAYPRGLFYGGDGPSWLVRLLEAHLGRWLGGSTDVVHLDFHTGLGRYGTWKLLIDYRLTEAQRARLTAWYGSDSFAEDGLGDTHYVARGGFGRWCASRGLAPAYLFACAEFGTYGPLKMLAGMRAENQAHHWGDPAGASTAQARQRLRQLFCPDAADWRTRVIADSVALVNRAAQGLAESSAQGR
ncbi:MAG: DUF2817 domain-containing protein [Gemmataceae bacterium]